MLNTIHVVDSHPKNHCYVIRENCWSLARFWDINQIFELELEELLHKNNVREEKHQTLTSHKH